MMQGPSAAGAALQSLVLGPHRWFLRVYARARFGDAVSMLKFCRHFAAGIAFAVLFAGAGQATAREPAGAKPLDDPSNWVTPDDYPKMALDDGKQGSVRFALDIDPNGRPTLCHVLQSSGDEELDLTACNLITLRARFSPARDTRGRAVPGTYKNAVKWVVPSTAPAPESTALEFSVIVGIDGSVSDCKIVRAGGSVAKAIAEKKGPCDKPPSFDPFHDASGQAVARRVTVLHEIKVEAP